MSVMQMLYCGRIFPAEDIVVKDQEYSKLIREVEKSQLSLSGKLSKEDFTLLEQMLSDQAEADSILAAEHFKYGLSLGLRLMKESEELPYLKKAGKS